MNKDERYQSLERIAEYQVQALDVMAVLGHAQADNSELVATLIEKIEELAEEVRRLRAELQQK